MKAAFIGIGNVGFAIADQLQKRGHQVIVASDNAKSESARKAKDMVSGLIEEMGFFVKDTGPLNQSLHLEHMTLLWVKMVRMVGNPHFVWAYLER